MAYMSQEKKAKIAPVVKKILTKYKLKGSLSVNNHSTLVLTIKSGKIDFIKNYNDAIAARDPSDVQRIAKADSSLQVNPYWYDEHFTGKAHSALKELFTAMNDGNHDHSDIMTDYFNVGWYVDVNVGRWNKPYIVA